MAHGDTCNTINIQFNQPVNQPSRTLSLVDGSLRVIVEPGLTHDEKLNDFNGLPGVQ